MFLEGETWRGEEGGPGRARGNRCCENDSWARIPGRKRDRMGLHPGLCQSPERGACGRFPAPLGAAAGIRTPVARASCWWWHLWASVPQEVASVIQAGMGSQGPASWRASSLPSRTVPCSVLSVVPLSKSQAFSPQIGLF